MSDPPAVGRDGRAALPAALPPVEIGGDGLFDGLGLGGVPFESEAFNDRFRVSCDDPLYASALVHPRMMALTFAHQRGITRVRQRMPWEPAAIARVTSDLVAQPRSAPWVLSSSSSSCS